MSSADLWLRRLAAHNDHDAIAANAKRERVAAEAVRELWEELQRCAAVFNFHSSGGRNIKIFLHPADEAGADVIFARATMRLVYREDMLQMTLITIDAFDDREREKIKFYPRLSRLGLLYWEGQGGQQLSSDMLVRLVFEQLLEHALD